MDDIIFSLTANQMTYAYSDYIFISDKWDRLLILLSKNRKKYKFLANRIASHEREWAHFGRHEIGVDFACCSVATLLLHLSGEYTHEIEKSTKRKTKIKLLSFSLFMICLVYIKMKSSIQRQFYTCTADFILCDSKYFVICFLSFYYHYFSSFSTSTNRCCTVWR